MNKIFVTSVNEDGYGIGVVPEMAHPDWPGFYETDMLVINSYEEQCLRYNNHLASLPTLLIHPSLDPKPNAFIESWQEGYEQCVVGSGGDSNGPNMVWVKTIKEIYDDYKPVFPNDYRKVAIPVTEKEEVGHKDAYQLYQFLRITDVLPALDADKKRLLCEAIESYSKKPLPTPTLMGENPDDWNPAEIAHQRLLEEFPDYKRTEHNTFGSTWSNGYCQALRDNEKAIIAPLPTSASTPSAKNEPRQEGDSLIEDAVNAYFHQTVDRLGEKDLGDIEKKQLENIKKKCEDWFKQHPL